MTDHSFGARHTFIDETVKVAKEFLEKHPEEIKTKKPKFNRLGRSPGGYVKSPLAFQIAEFLGWGEKKVNTSIDRLDLGVSWI